jgi:hypothetical protein
MSSLFKEKTNSMKLKPVLVFVMLAIFTLPAVSQEFVKTEDLFRKDDSRAGDLNIVQDPGLDTLISRYILMSQKVNGMTGFRIQIFNSSSRNAREESRKARAGFMSKYPEITSVILYSEPGYFKVRVGNFRTKAQAAQVLRAISRDFPNAYIVPDIINFPELERN